MEKHIFNTDKERLDYLHSLVNVLPDMPGVYQYFNCDGKIIYVGKAKNLKRRVSQYFMNKAQSPKTTVLVSKICHIHHIVVNNEEDALLLENNLIKQYQPQYNILLKDDKTYPWIVVKNEPFPRVMQTRNHVRDGSIYYGPYPNISKIHDLFDVFKNLFPLRTCSLNLSPENIKKGAYKVCLKYHLRTCMGPCQGLITEDEYAVFISSVRSILRGNTSQVLRSMRTEMLDAADALDFERAESVKKKILRLTDYQSRSTVASTSIINADVFAVVNDEEKSSCYVNFTRVTDGQILQSYTMEFRRRLEEPDAEVLTYALQEVRQTMQTLQREVVVPILPDVHFSDVKFVIPQSGDKKKLLELAEKNARLYKLELLKREANKNMATHEEKLMIQIREHLALKEMPRHIEMFDNSNIQGTSAVASCVVYKDCKPSKTDYRLFNIKTVEGPDDYASMFEVVYRRYSRLKEEGLPMPNLIVADGGVGQMDVIRQATEDALDIHIPIIGLAKDNKHRTNQILVGFPPKVIGIGKNDAVFRFFTRMQDEVHRFAITFHRKKRSQNMLVSELDSIAGIGPKTKQKLFLDFKSVDAVRSASLDDLTKSIGKSKANVVFYYFHVEENFEKES